TSRPGGRSAAGRQESHDTGGLPRTPPNRPAVAPSESIAGPVRMPHRVAGRLPKPTRLYA
ncbi:hypothetical protein, partial [Streptomyces sp. NPDC059744]|uniref:hypothetical protein n=1 Tax=Streptomyces sp. NPDC059744 TaxID=3346929 RepID=UPI003650C7EA